MLLEIDCATEPAATLTSKATAYRRVWAEGAWQNTWAARYGAPPTILWVVPDAARRDLVQRCWKQSWPQGTWMIATSAELQANSAYCWEQGQLHVVPLFAPLQAPVPTPAPAAPQVAASQSAGTRRTGSPSSTATPPPPTVASLPVGTEPPVAPQRPVPALPTPTAAPLAVVTLAAAPHPRRIVRALRQLATRGVPAAVAWTNTALLSHWSSALLGLMLLVMVMVGAALTVYLLLAAALLQGLLNGVQTLVRHTWRTARLVGDDGQRTPRWRAVGARVLQVWLIGLALAPLWWLVPLVLRG